MSNPGRRPDGSSSDSSDSSPWPGARYPRRYVVFGVAVGLLFATVGYLNLLLAGYDRRPLLALVVSVVYLAIRLQLMRRKHPAEVRGFEAGCMLLGLAIIATVLTWLALKAEFL